MPTVLTRSSPYCISLGVGNHVVSFPLLMSGIVASVLPDLDVLAFHFGVSYSHQFGHRGFSHSILFVVLLGLIALTFSSALQSNRMQALMSIFISTLS